VWLFCASGPETDNATDSALSALTSYTLHIPRAEFTSSSSRHFFLNVPSSPCAVETRAETKIPHIFAGCLNNLFSTFKYCGKKYNL
jgi:hypothetical protein